MATPTFTGLKCHYSRLSEMIKANHATTEIKSKFLTHKIRTQIHFALSTFTIFVCGEQIAMADVRHHSDFH